MSILRNIDDCSSLEGTSLSGSFSFEDKIDSDIEADLQDVIVKDGSEICNDYFSLSSSEALLSSTACQLNSPATKIKRSIYFKKATLAGVSNQLSNLSTKIDIGSPSCVSFNKHLVIGTTKGIIFVFSLNQTLRCCFGLDLESNGTNVAIGSDQGSITSLSQTLDGKQLISGYFNGHLAVWQLPDPDRDHKSSTLIRGKILLDDEDISDSDADRHDVPGTAGSESRNGSQVNLHATERSSLMQTSTIKKLRALTTRLSEGSRGRLLCVVDDAHGVGQSIAFCSFTTIPSLAVCVDTGGSVFQLTFKIGLTGVKRDSACFFSGSHGEVCALEALGSTSFLSLKNKVTCPTGELTPSSGTSSPQLSRRTHLIPSKSLTSYALIAMATFTKVIVATLYPRIQILYWRALKGPTTCFPVLSWKWHPQVSGSSIDPSEKAILAFGRGHVIHLIQVSKAPTAANKMMDELSFLTSNMMQSKISLSSSTSISLSDRSPLTIKTLGSIDLDYNLLSLKWLSSSQLGLLDTSELLHLYDCSSRYEFEHVQLGNVKLRYSSFLFKSAQEGGQASEALACVGERACMHSVVAHGSQLILLGGSAIHLVTLRSWSDVVHCMLTTGDVETALLLCLVSLDTARAGQQGNLISIPMFNNGDSDNDLIQIPPLQPSNLPYLELQTCVLKLLRDFFLPLLPKTEVLSDNAIRNAVLSACFLGDSDFLFSDLYSNLSKSTPLRCLFFETIYRVVHLFPIQGQCNFGEISKSCDSVLDLFSKLPPEIAMDFLAWCLDPAFDSWRAQLSNTDYNNKSGSQWAEDCLLRLLPICIDLNETVTLCWNHGLFNAYSHLYTDILMDFESPFRQLTQYVQDAVFQNAGETSSRVDDCVQCLLILLRNAFAARSFSHQPLPSPLCHDTPPHILRLLLNESTVSKRPSITTKDPTLSQYPRLESILLHSPVNLLNIFALAISTNALFCDESELSLLRRQHLLNKLFTLALNGCSSREDEDSIESRSVVRGTVQVSYPIHVFAFLSLQLINVGRSDAGLNPEKLFQLFQRICETHDPTVLSRCSSFESALINLINSDQFQSDDCLPLVKSVQLYSICEYIHRRQGQLFAALTDQLERLSLLVRNIDLNPVSSKPSLDDLSLNTEECSSVSSNFFDELGTIYSGGSHTKDGAVQTRLLLTAQEQSSFKKLCLNKLEVLLKCNAVRTLRLLYLFERKSMKHLLLLVLDKDVFGDYADWSTITPSLQLVSFTLLSAYYKCRQHRLDQKDSFDQDSDDLVSSSESTSATTDASSWCSFLVTPERNPELAECFVQLMLQMKLHSPLVQFLLTNKEYRPEFVLEKLPVNQFCSEAAMLYEKAGNVNKASDFYEQAFVSLWRSIASKLVTAAGASDEHDELDSFIRLRSLTESWFRFCQRQSSNNNNKDPECIWFKVVDVLLAERRSIDNHLLVSEMNDLFHMLLSFISYGSVPIASVVSYAVQNTPAESMSQYGPKTDTLLINLVSACQFEVEQMSTTRDMGRRELTRRQLEVCSRFRSGFRPNGLWCHSCGQTLRTTNMSGNVGQQITLFRCGHLFHLDCVSPFDGQATLKNGSNDSGYRSDDKESICPVCSPSAKMNSCATLPTSEFKQRWKQAAGNDATIDTEFPV